MTKLLEKGIAAVRMLPEERQDEIAEFLLSIARMGEYRLTPEQIEDVKIGLAEADRGEFLTPEEVEALWTKFDR